MTNQFRYWTPAKTKERRAFFIGGVLCCVLIRIIGFVLARSLGTFGLVLSWFTWIFVVAGAVVASEQVFAFLFRRTERVEVEDQTIRYFKSGWKPTFVNSLSEVVNLIEYTGQSPTKRYSVTLKGPRFFRFDSTIENCDRLVGLIEEGSGMSFQKKVLPSLEN